MKKDNPAQIVSVGGILTALAVLFQSSPVFLPGIGLILSPFATLPVALSAITSTYSGIITFLTSAFVLLLVSPQEAAIFMLATGALGLALGVFFKRGIIKTIAIAGLTLFIGINVMIHIAGIAAFGDLTPSTSSVLSSVILLIFSMGYSTLWVLVVKFFVNILGRQLDVFRPGRNK